MLTTRIKEVLVTILLTGGMFFTLLSLSYPFMSHASAEVPTPLTSSWTYCASDGEYCSFTGMKIVEYGWNMGLGAELWITKKLNAKTYTLTDGSSVEGVLCNANEFSPVSGGLGFNICMIRDLAPALDTIWSAAVGDDNKSVTVTFSDKETQVGTLDDLKKKIRIKRTDEANFKELDSEDSVSNSTTGVASTLQISFNRPLMGLDNQIRIDAGALADIGGDVFDRAIEINDLPENDLGVWQDVGNRGLSVGNTLDMSLISVNSTPFLAYIDGGAGNRLFVKKYDGNSWVQAGDALSTGAVGLQAFTRGFSMAVSNGTLYVAYCDAANGFKVSVKKYVGNSWLPVGNTDVSSGLGYEMSLAISDGIPYVAYNDNVNLGKITVKKYKESSNGWVTLGSMGFSQNAVSQISLSINEGIPYVAYRNEKPVRVNHNGMYYDEIEYSGVFKRFDEASGSWLDLGNFATGGFSTTSLNIYDGIPFIAYVDWLTGYGVTLKKYEGNSWTRADNNANFKVGDSSNISYTSFYFSEGTLYVAYRGIDFKDSVKKYNGSSWVSVGVLNGAAVLGKSLYVDNGVPYLAYSDFLIAGVYNDGRKPMVQKFLLTPSTLTADTTSNDTVSPIEVTFLDLAAWRNVITAVKYGTTVIPPADYTVSAGKITFKPGVLAVGTRLITVSAELYADAAVSQTMNLRPPSLTVDTTVNYVVNAIDVTFPDDEEWRRAIVAVKDGAQTLPSESYDVAAGKITFNAGTLAEGVHRITILATDYLETSVNQTVNWIPSPALTADTTDNNAASAIEITFTDAEGWSDEITAVKDGTKTISIAKYSINNGKLTLKAGALSLGSHTITVLAPNYADTRVSQIVFLKPPTLTADTMSNNLSNAIDISFTDDAAWRLAITAINDGATILPTQTYTISSGKITIKAGVLATGSHTIKVMATGFSVTTISQPISSSNVDLSGLSVSSGSLNFAPITTSYMMSVVSNVASITVTPTSVDATTSVTVAANGGTSAAVASGQPSAEIPLEVGANNILVVVKSQDGNNTKTYTIHVIRISNDALLSSLAVDQGTLAFVPSELDYTVEVANTVSSLNFTLIKTNPNQTLTVTGATNSTVTGNVYTYSASNLIVGSNPIQINVTAQDGMTMNPYHLVVNRAPIASSNSDLSGILLSNGTLSPDFASGITAYTSSVDNGVSSLTVTASVYDSGTTMTVNGITATSGQTSGIVNLNVGTNPIIIILTAQNGNNKTYVLTVTRGARVEESGNNGGGSTANPASGTIAPSDPPITSDDGILTLPPGKTGEVSLKNELTISIPADASEKELIVSIEKIIDTKNLLTNNEVLASPIFEILKNFSENFSKPVTLKLSFDPTKLNGDQRAAIFYFDEAKKVWIEVGGIVSGDHIIAEVNHFTKYAVFAVGRAVEIPIKDPSTETKPNLKFSDITGHWSETDIKLAVSSGIVTGYPDGTFKPNHTVTRAEFSVMLVNMLMLQGADVPLTFTDTAKIGAWAQKAVALAVREGIIKGYVDGSFRPDAEITRAEMAVMIANAWSHSSNKAEVTTGFADDKDIAAWAKSSVAFLKLDGIVQGNSNNQFAPQDLATRAEALTVLLKVKAQISK
ncbi:DUF1533 domain-containing protein [Paenibacillus psychroresistens]|uniref:DUF1533 domain-containing protein n=1 Tax=Paenibacillus psychroresistens TaxID=1778678 RepID=A0A6B8RR21_9BACL|nr:S-layer homology domain-containing protein [Paenibacillus psychroresistens]QGQ98841.1 DUF1533 domain-containing protein [Paenibacillus psychroresistens]